MLDDILWKDEKGASSLRWTLELFQRQHWGNLCEMGWSTCELSERIEIHHLELNSYWNLQVCASRGIVIGYGYCIHACNVSKCVYGVCLHVTVLELCSLVLQTVKLQFCVCYVLHVLCCAIDHSVLLMYCAMSSMLLVECYCTVLRLQCCYFITLLCCVFSVVTVLCYVFSVVTVLCYVFSVVTVCAGEVRSAWRTTSNRCGLETCPSLELRMPWHSGWDPAVHPPSSCHQHYWGKPDELATGIVVACVLLPCCLSMYCVTSKQNKNKKMMVWSPQPCETLVSGCNLVRAVEWTMLLSEQLKS